PYLYIIMDLCYDDDILFGHATTRAYDTLFTCVSRQNLAVIPDLDYVFIRQIARSLKVSYSHCFLPIILALLISMLYILIQLCIIFCLFIVSWCFYLQYVHFIFAFSTGIILYM